MEKIFVSFFLKGSCVCARHCANSFLWLLQLSWQLKGGYDRHLPNEDNIGKKKTEQILFCCSSLL